MPLEIERKFLVRSDAWRTEVSRRELLRQGYLSSGSRSSIRVRVAGEQAWLNLKSKVSGTTRLEYEYEIPRSEADEILTHLCDGPRIEKYRHWIVAGNITWEIDEFLSDNAGLVVAEVELHHEQQVFALPVWLGAEVTQDERYYNFNLARHPYRQWQR